MVTLCVDTSCNVLLNAECVFYTGAALPYTDINTNDDLQTALQKIEDVISGISGGAVWGSITGTIGSQTDLINYLAFTYITAARTLTINGVSHDLSANRSWSVGTITDVTASLPIASSGGTTPDISFVAPGLDTELYFNDAGVLGTNVNLTYNKTIGRLTLGSGITPPINGSRINALLSTSAAASSIINGFFYVDQTVANTGGPQGVEGYVETSNALGTVNLAIATIGNVEHSGAGTLTNARSIQGGGILSGAGNVTNWYAVYTQPVAITGTGTITNLYGVYIDTASAGAGTITNRWGVYSADTDATSFFAGNVSIGAGTAPIDGVRLTSRYTSTVSAGTAMNSMFFLDQTVANSGSGYALQGNAKSSNATGTVVITNGVNGSLNHSGAGTLQYGRPIKADGILSGAGTINNVQVIFSGFAITGSGTIDDYYGAYLEAPVAGAGTITRRWGLYSDDANANSYFAGQLGVGVTPAVSTRLHVRGANNGIALLVEDDAGNDIIKAEEIAGNRQITLQSTASTISLIDDITIGTNLFDATAGLGFSFTSGVDFLVTTVGNIILNSTGVINITSPAVDDTITNILVIDGGGDIKIRTVASLPTGGITNGAANTELMKSDGTNAISSKIFVPSNGDLTLGDGTLAGDRTISVASSTANADLILTAAGTGQVFIGSKAGNHIEFNVDSAGNQQITSSDDLAIVPTSGRDLYFGGSPTCNYGFNAGGLSWGTSEGVIGIVNRGVAPSAAINGGILIYSEDSGDSNATLALYTEQVPEATATFTQTHRIKVRWNGTEYWLSLDAV